MNEPCLLLLARPGDPVIGALRRLLPQRLCHADVPDLSRAGWRYVVGRPQLATACASGRVLAAGEIAAVLCRIVAVVPQDLEYLHAEDRAFAAAEMNAFLRAWLTQFAGRLCNQPSPASLAGPAWHAMRWRGLAAQLNVPVVASYGNALDSSGMTVLVAGNQVVGTADVTLTHHSLRIASAAHSRLLALRFVWDGQWRFESAESFPQSGTQGMAKLLEWAMGAPDACAHDLRIESCAAAG
jgi:hypothetical protein